jgi:NAD(P)-dependent dehydrogenase (short-subunit alcohol dehydrogenase family)
VKPHALVIGGTRGIGRELVRLFAEENHTVSVIGKRPPAEHDRGLGGVDYWTVDLVREPRIAEVLAEVVERNGSLNYLVFLQRFRGDGDAWAGELETSLSATKKVIEQLIDRLDASSDCGIVVVSSIADQYVIEGQPVGYHVAKAGLHQMVRYYAVKLGPRGIRVNAVSPGTVLKEENRDFYLTNAELQDLFRRAIPLGRMGTARETANVIAFLCSPKASFVTGQNIVVDGGVSLRSQEALARALTGR